MPSPKKYSLKYSPPLVGGDDGEGEQLFFLTLTLTLTLSHPGRG